MYLDTREVPEGEIIRILKEYASTQPQAFYVKVGYGFCPPAHMTLIFRWEGDLKAQEIVRVVSSTEKVQTLTFETQTEEDVLKALGETGSTFGMGLLSKTVRSDFFVKETGAFTYEWGGQLGAWEQYRFFPGDTYSDIFINVADVVDKNSPEETIKVIMRSLENGKPFFCEFMDSSD